MNKDFEVTHDAIYQNNWQIASLVIQKSLFTVTHALFFIYDTWNKQTAIWLFRFTMINIWWA